MKTSALCFTGVDRVELAETNIPDPGPSELVVAAAYSAISPGTELRCLSGRQHGGAFPFIPGYSLVGHVAARGRDVKLTEGTPVFCRGTERASHSLLWGAHMAHALCDASRVFPVPPGVDLLEASLAKLSAIAYRGVRVADTRPHEEVAVVGLGAIGQLAARLHAIAGARVVAGDLEPTRVQLARAAGLEALVPADGLASAFARYQPKGADVVVDATGAPAVLAQSIQLAKAKPWDDAATTPTRLVIQGSYVENVAFSYREAFARELIVHFPRDNQAGDIAVALRLLAEGRLKARDLISTVAEPARAPEIYAALRAARPGLITAVFKWP